MDMKEKIINGDTSQTVHINESYFFNEEDIYYNKDKFDSGEINLSL